MNIETTEVAIPSTLDAPGGLGPHGRLAHQIVRDFLVARELTDTGGCRAFYSPDEWRARGELYGHGSVLICVYDGGDHRYAFSMDAALDSSDMRARYCREEGIPYDPSGCYKTIEDLQDVLRPSGLYVEECGTWYAAVYEIKS